MVCAKLVFALLLTVFLSQQYSSATSYQELKEKAKSHTYQLESVTKILEQLKDKYAGQSDGSSSLQMTDKFRELESFLEKANLLSRMREKMMQKQAYLSPRLQDFLAESKGVNMAEKLEKLRTKISEMSEEKQAFFAPMKRSMLASVQSPDQVKEETQKLALNGNGTSDGKSLENCLAVVIDIIKQNLSFITIQNQITTNTITNLYALLQCFQGGASSTSSACLQNVVSQIPGNITKYGNQTLSALSSIEGDFGKLSTCLSST